MDLETGRKYRREIISAGTHGTYRLSLVSSPDKTHRPRREAPQEELVALMESIEPLPPTHPLSILYQTTERK